MKWLLTPLVITLLIGCNKKETNKILRRENLPSQTFQIDPSKDTILVTSTHCKISILEGTFEGKSTVDIEVREALSLNDIVLSGLTTLSGKQLLKSGGMIYINGKQHDSVARILKPIEISLPTKTYQSNMRLFSGQLQPDNSLDWKDPQLPLSRQEVAITQNGKALFNACAACHAINKNVIAPALAFVTERRCMDWLKEAVREPQRLLQKDRCFAEQKKTYGELTMTSFPAWSDTDINSIFAYIKTESEKYRNTEGAPHSYDPCDHLVLRDTLGHTPGIKVDSVKIGKNTNPPPGLVNVGSPKNDTIPGNKTSGAYRELPDDYYIFTINSFGWYNIDCYVQDGNAVQEANLSVTVNGASDQDLEVYLVIPSEKLFVPGHKSENGKYFFYEEDGRIPLPQNKPAFIIALRSFSDKASFGKLSFTTSVDQQLNVIMHADANIEQEIKSMKLDDLEFDIEHVKLEKRLLITEQLYQFECPGKSNSDSSSSTAEANILDQSEKLNK